MHNMESGMWIDELRIVVRSRSSPFSSLRSYPVQSARFAPDGDATTCIFLGGQAYRYLCQHTLILVKLGQETLEHIVVEHIVEHVGTYRTPTYFTLVLRRSRTFINDSPIRLDGCPELLELSPGFLSDGETGLSGAA
jgi:hypothetical protein